MVHQVELVVCETIPGSFYLQWALTLAPIGVTQIQRNDAIAIAERVQRVEGVVGETSDGRVQTAAGDDKQRETGT